jgi:hypothetical protein
VTVGPRPTGGAREVIAVALLFAIYHLVYFAPALIEHRLLAPGDGLIYYLPALLSKAVLWNHALYAGHPAFADAQALFFNPLRMIGNYNGAVIVVYVVASTAAYCLVRYLTGMRLAGVFAGFVYGSGGAMIAHLGHLTIIYSAAWIPLIAWAVARARDSDCPAAVAIGAVAVAGAILGGHPQIFVYGLALTGLYALHSLLDPSGRHRGALALRYAILFGAGLAIACVQLLPLAELGGWSVREKMTFDEFVSFSLDRISLLMLFFPKILGDFAPFDVSYFGPWNPTELATYAGIGPLLLALAAFGARRRERDVVFWLAATIVAIMYALGKSTPLAELAFHVPGLREFRAPARSAFVTTLAVAVLGGYGLRAIAQRRVTGWRFRRLRRRTLILLGIPIVSLVGAYPAIVALAAANGQALPPLWRNPAMWSGLVAMFVSGLLVYAAIRYRPQPALLALVVVVALDLASFGWFKEWRGGPDRSEVAPDEDWTAFSKQVAAAHDRVLFVDGSRTLGAPTRPDLNLLYDLPSASGYGPLILRDYAAVMGMTPTGSVASTNRLDTRLRVGGIGWVIAGDDPARGFRFGGDCSSSPGLTDTTFRLPKTLRVAQVEVVSQLFCSVAVPQDAPMIDLAFAASATEPETKVSIVAGRDTAEWAIDRSDVAAAIQHRRPRDSESYPAGSFSGRWFRTRIALRGDGQEVDADRLHLEWQQPPAPGIIIRSIDLVDGKGGRHRISGDDLLRSVLGGGDSRLAGAKWIARFADTRGSAWLVDEVVTLADDASLAAVRSGRLADGRTFDPYRTALTPEGASPPRVDAGGPSGSATIMDWSDGALRVDTNAPGPRFLVVAQSYYPGWRASIDGKPVGIIRTNVAFQGVTVPAGKHTVLFSFVPTSLRLAVAIALLGIAVIAIYLLAASSRRRGRASMNSVHVAMVEPARAKTS